MSFTDPDATRVQEAEESEGIRAMRERLDQQAAENKALAEANATLQRKAAFADAKLPDSPQAKFFAENYQGEMTAEAIRAAAQSYGFIAEPGPTAEQNDQINLIEDAVSGAPGAIHPTNQTAVIEEWAQVRSGPQAADQIEAIMRKHGYRTAQDFE